MPLRSRGGLHCAMPAHIGRAAALGRGVAARDQARRLPRDRAQERRSREALQLAGHSAYRKGRKSEISPLGQSIQNPTRPTKGANAMPKVQADRLEDIGRALFVAAGAPEAEANLVMHHIVPGAPWVIVKESPTTTVVDGHWGFGYVANERTMRLTIEKAEKSNVAAATVFRQGHIGRLSSYTQIAAQAGMIGLITADSGRSQKAVAPFGGREARLGTNPI